MSPHLQDNFDCIPEFTSAVHPRGETFQLLTSFNAQCKHCCKAHKFGITFDPAKGGALQTKL
jgi:hypothetical protein